MNFSAGAADERGDDLTLEERLEVATRAGLTVHTPAARSVACFKVELVLDDMVHLHNWPNVKETAAIRRALLGMEDTCSIPSR